MVIGHWLTFEAGGRTAGPDWTRTFGQAGRMFDAAEIDQMQRKPSMGARRLRVCQYG
jgi:hypothetical protein